MTNKNIIIEWRAVGPGNILLCLHLHVTSCDDTTGSGYICQFPFESD